MINIKDDAPITYEGFEGFGDRFTAYITAIVCMTLQSDSYYYHKVRNILKENKLENPKLDLADFVLKVYDLHNARIFDSDLIGDDTLDITMFQILDMAFHDLVNWQEIVDYFMESINEERSKE